MAEYKTTNIDMAKQNKTWGGTSSVDGGKTSNESGFDKAFWAKAASNLEKSDAGKSGSGASVDKSIFTKAGDHSLQVDAGK